MEWHHWFVVSWMQFAFSSLFVLFMTSVAIRWIPQPIEKARLIQGVIVSLFALPLLSVFPVFPSSSLSLSSWIALASQTETTRTRQEQPTPTIIANRIQVKDSKDLASSFVPEPAVHRNPLPSEVVPEKEVRTSFSMGPIESPVQNHQPSLQLTGSELDVWYVACVALILVQSLATLTFAVQHWLGTTRLRKILLSAIPATEFAKSRWAEITNGLRPKVQLSQSSEIKTPLTFGWRKPIVILPVELVVKAGSDLDACLAHEWSHIERSDAVVWIWMNLAQYASWYQPFYWMLRNELRLCQEFLADHKTVNSVTEPIVYSELLLRLSKIQSGSLPQSALAMFRPSSQLSRRIQVLLDSESILQTRCRGRFTVGMLVGLVLLAMSISSIRIETAHASEPIEQRATDEPKATVTDAAAAKSARSMNTAEGHPLLIISKSKSIDAYRIESD